MNKKDNTPLPLNEQLEQQMIHPSTFKELYNLTNKEMSVLLGVPIVTITGWSRLPMSQTPASPLVMRCLYYIHISRKQSNIIDKSAKIIKRLLSFITTV